MAKLRKKPFFNKRRRSLIAELNLNYIDYKDIDLLSKFVTGTGQIKARSLTGLDAKDQRKVAMAIKRARFMALMPYAKERIRVLSRPTVTNEQAGEKSSSVEKTEK
ncbi:30S ribosomal protein S18 [Mycoplasmopsis californica HAZ160_1]|uniref:Small ribosomal subunit protein bS18 n=2 Tax=Mycoplasmopsis californica TaxID=2113 RepID=A0A059XRV0_9BACT|nr:30S ribosomal protein S18 [Mycoplasmopsis californica]AIA29548.1 30S ribosomal protein S18 [Mycoplasmopsis californica]BAP01008.1 30S ribosomal protein S18 [Mycoplasmopsis californica HAZ160_1]BBG40873.1 30S ribosomal protein S18 [Mycoplasmopsis californica]BBG41467.1 30S ribosomal protein S18 [Mycoplasmopsis californica]BBG42060.1 30S ribosomal protein S18 [Mycoplasmopsis californica]